MKRIAIFQYDLSLGGIQKSLINLLNSIDLEKYSIDLFLFNKENFYDSKIPSKVNIIYLKKYPIFFKFMPFVFLKRIITKNVNGEYDVAIDFNGYSNECAISALKTKCNKKIIWCHNDISVKYDNEWKYRILYTLFKSKYKCFDTIVNVSEGARKSFIKKTKIDSERVVSIPNIINTDEILKKCLEETEFQVDENKINLVSVGRICHQKGFDILINYIKNVTSINKNIILYIIGDGPDFKKIYNKVKNNNLLDNVVFLGGKQNPFKYMNKMDAFVLTSRYEGQGMAILEAKSLGLPVIIPKHLEKYVENISGTYDIEKSILEIKKTLKQVDRLEEYNNNIKTKLINLLES